jgi:hypothetical protein
MIQAAVSFSGAFAALVLCEIAKQVGVTWFKSEVPAKVASGLKWLDRMLPWMITQNYELDKVEESLRGYLGGMTGDEWEKIDQTFSVRIFLQKLAERQANDDNVEAA